MFVIHVMNDIHGAKPLIDAVVTAIGQMRRGDTVIINGDGAGARGKIMNNLIRIYYEVRRGESDEATLLAAIKEIIGTKPSIPKEWIYDTVHGGLFRALLAERYARFEKVARYELIEVLDETLKPLSEAANTAGVKLVYLPGNGEIVPNDFSTKTFTEEITVDPESRFYQKLLYDGFFEKYNIDYVPYAAKMGDTILIGINLLDMGTKQASILLKNVSGDDTFKTVIAHYPPAVSPIGGSFSFWTPNKMDIKRSEALKAIADSIRLSENVQFAFGHIHLGATDPRMMPFPSTMGFKAAGYQCTWVKPGAVLSIEGSQQ